MLYRPLMPHPLRHVSAGVNLLIGCLHRFLLNRKRSAETAQATETVMLGGLSECVVHSHV
jgi:hypothetical protein